MGIYSIPVEEEKKEIPQVVQTPMKSLGRTQDDLMGVKRAKMEFKKAKKKAIGLNAINKRKERSRMKTSERVFSDCFQIDTLDEAIAQEIKALKIKESIESCAKLQRKKVDEKIEQTKGSPNYLRRREAAELRKMNINKKAAKKIRKKKNQEERKKTKIHVESLEETINIDNVDVKHENEVNSLNWKPYEETGGEGPEFSVNQSPMYEESKTYFPDQTSDILQKARIASDEACAQLDKKLLEIQQDVRQRDPTLKLSELFKKYGFKISLDLLEKFYFILQLVVDKFKIGYDYLVEFIDKLLVLCTPAIEELLQVNFSKVFDWTGYLLDCVALFIAIYFIRDNAYMGIFIHSITSKYIGDAGGILLSLISTVVSIMTKQSEIVVESFDCVTSFLDTILNSEVFSCFRTLFLSLFSFKVFGDRAKGILTLFFGGKEHGSILHLAKSVFVVIERLIAISALILGGMSISEALLSQNPLDLYVKKLNDLLASDIYYGLPKEGNISANEFLTQFRDIQNDRNALLKTRIVNNSRWVYIEGLYRDARLRSEGIKINIESHRVTPVSIVNCGDPGVGKSTMLDTVLRVLCSVHNWKYDPNIVYAKVISSEYWEGYDPLCQKIIHLSELGNVSKKIVENSGDPNLNLFCTLVSQEKMNLNMAAVDLKGKISASPYVVYIDTNNESLNADAATGHGAAIRRRSIYIEQKVNEPYRKEGGSCELDVSKIDGVDYDDIWTFTVYKYQSVDAHRSKKEFNYIYNYSQVVTLLVDLFRAHAIKLDNATYVSDNIGSKISKIMEAKVDVEAEEMKFPIVAMSCGTEFDTTPISYFEEGKGEESHQVNWCTCGNIEGHTVYCQLYEGRHYINERMFEVSEQRGVIEVEANDNYITRIVEVIHNKFYSPRAYNMFQHCHRVAAYTSKVGKYCLAEANVKMRLWALNDYIKDEFQFDLKLLFILLYLFLIIYSLCGIGYAFFIGINLLFFYAHQIKNLSLSGLARRYVKGKLLLKQDIAERDRRNAWNDLRDYVTDDVFVADSLSFLSREVLCVAGAITTITGIYTLTKYLRRARPQTEASDKDMNHIEETEIYGVSKSYTRVASPQMLNWTNAQKNVVRATYTGDEASFIAMVSGNTRHVMITRNEGKDIIVTYAYALMIRGRYGLMNKHSFPEKGLVSIKVNTTGLNQQASYTVETVVNCEKLIAVHEDVVLIKFQGAEARDITKHLYKQILDIGTGFVVTTPISFVLDTEKLKIRMNGDRGYISYSPTYRYEWIGHCKGKCGLPLIAKLHNNSFCIIGLHSAGSDANPTSYAIPLATIDWTKIDELRAESIELDISDLPLISPSERSMTRFIPLTTIQYYGRLENVTVLKNQKSHLQGTFFKKSSSLRKFLYDRSVFDITEFTRPVMKHKTINGFYICPYQNNVEQWCGPRPCPDLKILGEAVKVYFDRVSNGLKGITIQPWDVDTAINGAVYDPFCRKLNMSTGTGYPFIGKKYQYFERIDVKGLIKYEMIPELKLMIKERIAEIESGKAKPFIYEGCLKDEPVSLAKASIAKTRLFSSGNLVDLIIMRMFLGPILTLMIEFNDLFCTAVGIDAHRDGDKFMKFFEFKEQDWDFVFGEGDYKYYDKKQGTALARAMNEFIILLAKSLGYNERALRFLSFILEMNVCPFYIVLGDLYCVPGSQPSGMYGTAETNSLKGALMIIYVYLKLGGDPQMIWDYLRFKTYGDDLLTAMSKYILGFFDMVKFSSIIESDFGLQFTSSDKTTELQPFIPSSDITFLKRNIKYSTKLKRFIMVLDISSIVRSLEWVNPSDEVSPEKQMISCAQSALREIFFHENINFDEFRTLIIHDIATNMRFNEKEIRSMLPTYDDILLSLQPQYNDVSGGSTSPSKMAVSKTREDDLEVNKGIIVTESLDRHSNSEWSAEEKDHERDFNQNLKEKFVENQMALIRMKKEFEMLVNPNPNVTYFTAMRSELYHKNESYKKAMDKFWGAKFAMDSLAGDIATLRRILNGRGVHVESDSIVIGNTPDEVKHYENVQDVSGEPSAEMSSKGFPYDSRVSDIGDLGEFLKRPVLIYNSDHYGWTPNAYGGIQLQPMSLLLLNPTIRAKLRNFAYMRATLCIRVVFSGTPFHSGKVVVCLMPLSGDNLNLNVWDTVDLTGEFSTKYLCTQVKKKIISVHDNKPLEIRHKHLSYLPLCRLFNSWPDTLGASSVFDDYSGYAELYVRNLNDIRSVSNQSGHVSASIYAWLEDVEIGTSTGTKMEIVVESDERKVGPIEKITSKMAHAMYELRNIPYLGRYALASSSISKGISNISAILGYSYPTKYNDPTYTKHYVLQNGCHTIGMGTGKKLTLDPGQEVTVDTSFCGIDNDEMVISYICSIPSMITKVEWITSSTPMIPLATIPVTPTLPSCTGLIGNYRYTQPSNMSFAAGPFNYWSGDVTFILQLVKSQFHRGKIAVVWEPNGYQMSLTTGDQYLAWQNTVILDLQETKEAEFTVHWKRKSDWLPLQYIFDTGYADTSADAANGVLKIYPITTLTSPDDTVPVEINIWSYSKNMRFNVMNRNQYLLNTSEVVVESLEFLVNDDIMSYSLNEETNSGDNISVLHFGEEPISFRALLKKFDTIAPITCTPATAVRVVVPIGKVHDENNLFSYLYHAYLGRRGGMRFRFIRAQGVSDGDISTAWLNPPSSMFLDAISVDNTASLKHTMNNYVRFYGGNERTFEIEAPYYSANLMTPNYNEGSLARNWVRQYVRYVSASVISGSTINSQFGVVDRAVADDFSFVRYIGPPGRRELF
ncbi:hypothetical protein [Beihai picorna-like virus 59]|uniref:hypothetical protein n=1 Tax=Beihai picorna-like virus 59 TaxID=1922604 RepID=UPI00090B19EF|nr:hypothetical protein [Beihai picorna-like virus 59]APG76708.1 hypothetical protein [Beihai picorna-like virus 59]APG78921.1 hypothetical protein [Beihai picorna-like virus 59]